MSSLSSRSTRVWEESHGAKVHKPDNSSKLSGSSSGGSNADSGYGSECTLRKFSEDDERILTSNRSVSERHGSCESSRLTPAFSTQESMEPPNKNSLHKAASKTCKMFADTIRSKTQIFYVASSRAGSPHPTRDESPPKRLEKVKTVVSLRGRGGRQPAVDQEVNQQSTTRISGSVNLPHELDVDIPDSNLQGLTLDVESSDQLTNNPSGMQPKDLLLGPNTSKVGSALDAATSPVLCRDGIPRDSPTLAYSPDISISIPDTIQTSCALDGLCHFSTEDDGFSPYPVLSRERTTIDSMRPHQLAQNAYHIHSLLNSGQKENICKEPVSDNKSNGRSQAASDALYSDRAQTNLTRSTLTSNSDETAYNATRTPGVSLQPSEAVNNGLSYGLDVLFPRCTEDCNVDRSSTAGGSSFVSYSADVEPSDRLFGSQPLSPEHTWMKMLADIEPKHLSSGQAPGGKDTDTDEIPGLPLQSHQNTKLLDKDRPRANTIRRLSSVNVENPEEINFSSSGTSGSLRKTGVSAHSEEGTCTPVDLDDQSSKEGDNSLKYAVEAIERLNGDGLDTTEKEVLMDKSAIRYAIDAIDRFDGVTLDSPDERRPLSLNSIEFAVEAIDRPTGTMLEDLSDLQELNTDVPIMNSEPQVGRSTFTEVLGESPSKSLGRVSEHTDLLIESNESTQLNKFFSTGDSQVQGAPESHSPHECKSEDAAIFNSRIPSSSSSSNSISTSDSCAITTHGATYYAPPPSPHHVHTHPVRNNSSIKRETYEVLDGSNKSSFLGSRESLEWHSVDSYVMLVEARSSSPTNDPTCLAEKPGATKVGNINILSSSQQEFQPTKHGSPEVQVESGLDKDNAKASSDLMISTTVIDDVLFQNGRRTVEITESRSSSMYAPDKDFMLDLDVGERTFVKHTMTRSSSLCAADGDFRASHAGSGILILPRTNASCNPDTLSDKLEELMGQIQHLSLIAKPNDDLAEGKDLSISRRDATPDQKSDKDHSPQNSKNCYPKCEILSHSSDQSSKEAKDPAFTNISKSLGLDSHTFVDDFDLEKLPPLPPSVDISFSPRYNADSLASPVSSSSEVRNLRGHKQRQMSSTMTSSLNDSLNSQDSPTAGNNIVVPCSKFVRALSNYFKPETENNFFSTPSNSPQKPDTDSRQSSDKITPSASGQQSIDNSTLKRDFIAARLPLFGSRDMYGFVRSDSRQLSQRNVASRLQGLASGGRTLTSPTNEPDSSIPIASRLNKTRSAQSKKRTWKIRESDSGEEGSVNGTVESPKKSPKRDLVTSSMKKGIWWGRDSKEVQEAESPLAHKAEVRSTTSNTTREELLAGVDKHVSLARKRESEPLLKGDTNFQAVGSVEALGKRGVKRQTESRQAERPGSSCPKAAIDCAGNDPRRSIEDDKENNGSPTRDHQVCEL